MNENGQQQKVCEATVLWNPDAQTFELKFNPSEFKTWPMLEAVFRMGADLAKFNGNLGMMHGIQQQAAEAQQAVQIRQQLKL